MNKMKEVAQLLGVKLEEEFKIKDSYALFKISDGGLMMRYSSLCEWGNNDETLGLLLRGVCKIERNILTEKEKEYLNAMIKPFKEKINRTYKKARINCIYKMETSSQVLINVVSNPENAAYRDLLISIPIYNETAFKGMELYREYSLEELGL